MQNENSILAPKAARPGIRASNLPGPVPDLTRFSFGSRPRASQADSRNQRSRGHRRSTAITRARSLRPYHRLWPTSPANA